MQEQTYRCSRVCRILGNPVTLKIVTLLLEKGWSTPADLSKKTHRKVSTISGHLKSLRQEDVVRYEGIGNNVKYRIKYKKQTKGLLANRGL